MPMASPIAKLVHADDLVAGPAKQYAKLGGDAEEAGDRVCLCNALLSTAGFDKDNEPPLITLGQSGTRITARHTAQEVIEDILGEAYVSAARRATSTIGP